jgi:hypothetical protein
MEIGNCNAVLKRIISVLSKVCRDGEGFVGLVGPQSKFYVKGKVQP